MRRPGRRPLWLTAAAAVLIPAAAYLFFELGRYQAGYSVIEHRRELEALKEAKAADEATVEELKRQLAILQTSRDIDRETYSQVEVSLADLEAKLQAQEEELAFYRGIISPADGVAGLRIQSFEASPGPAEQQYTLRLVLMQAIVHNRRVDGVVRLKLTGRQDGEPAELTLGDLTGEGGAEEIAYDFRYFQGLEQDIALPVGFEPDSVEVEIRPKQPRGDAITQTFDWDAVSGQNAEDGRDAG